MKAKSLLFYFVILLIVFFSCDKEDNNAPDEIVLTAENNYYEGDLFERFLKDSIASLDASIVELDSLIQQGIDSVTNVELRVQRQEQRGVFTIFLNNQNDVAEEVFQIVPRIKPDMPDPPSPCQITGGCIPRLMNYITMSTDLKNLSIMIKSSETDEVVASTEITSNPLSDYNSLVSAGNINVSNFEGLVYFEVERIFQDNSTFSYTTDTYQLY